MRPFIVYALVSVNSRSKITDAYRYALCAIDVEFTIKHAPTRYYQASALNKLHNSVNCTIRVFIYAYCYHDLPVNNY